MIPPLFYYIAFPFIIAFAVIKLIKKYSGDTVPEDVVRLCLERPIQKKWFRAVRRDGAGLKALGDFETHADAVDCAYLGRKEGRAAGQAASFIVLNAKGEALEQVDS